MDAEPLGGGLNLFERFPRFIELLLGDQTILRLETLWSLLWPSIRAEDRKSKDEAYDKRMACDAFPRLLADGFERRRPDDFGFGRSL